MEFLKKTLAVAIMLILLTSCSQGNAIEVGKYAPDFTLTDMNSQKVSLTDFKGKAMILNFFASWCPPCRGEIPDFVALQKAYGDKDFTFVGVSLVGAQESKDFAAKMRINYPILIDDGKVSVAYGPVRAIPTTYVIDKYGKIVKMYIGFKPKEIFEQDIKEALK